MSCLACNDNLWWCRGCGGARKIKGMVDSGMSQRLAEAIYNVQFAGCDKPCVPCFVCNRNGQREPKYALEHDDKICNFWTS